MHVQTRTPKDRNVARRQTDSKVAKAYHWLLALIARIMFWRELPELKDAELEPGGDVAVSWHVVAWRQESGGKRKILSARRFEREEDFEAEVLNVATKYRGCQITVMTPNGGGRLTSRARRAVIARARRLLMPRGVGRQARKLQRAALIRDLRVARTGLKVAA